MEFSHFLQINLASLPYFIPELMLVATLLALIIIDLVMKKPSSSGWLAVVALAGVLITLITVVNQYNLDSRSLFNGMLVLDHFSLFFKVLFLLAASLAILFSMASIELAGRPVGEYFTLLIALVLGMFLMAASTNLIMIYISIELVSISSFVLAAYIKRATRSSEAGLKYAIYGAFSSGLMLYGFSLLYGLTGTLDLYQLANLLSDAVAQNPLVVFLAVLFILAGFGYKIAAVPFHFWAPDVYEGAPTPMTAFFSVGPKAAGFALLIRFFVSGMSQPSLVESTVWQAIGNVNWPQLLAVISAATMTLGNLIALVQNNVKRLLAYSSIAHAGYALMGTVVLTQEGYFATLFYLVAYYLMNMGAFLVVIVFQDLIGSEKIDDYRGLGYRAPLPAVAMGLFLFSLTGLPPTVGFIGKFYLFAALIKAGEQYYWLAVVGVLNSVVSLYYYVKIMKYMFLDRPSEEKATALPVAFGMNIMLIVLMVPILLFGLYWAPLQEFTRNSIQFFTGVF
ncbi:MAG: NADH-quinone oxidoreductase subunit N [candidate division KSB1 bacterium]|nr:NADH-quinone oxidoreductase subunit N [candidate division KSB1 bacterium]MDQ7063221.1 NADH-quinone oxidoreductase subunit N [candidate division KSB1 bacterium]